VTTLTDATSELRQLDPSEHQHRGAAGQQGRHQGGAGSSRQGADVIKLFSSNVTYEWAK